MFCTCRNGWLPFHIVCVLIVALVRIEALDSPVPTATPGSTITTVRNVPVHRNPLRRGDRKSPFCYGASSSLALPPGSNFLATQLWPSARAAALAVERYARRSWTLCEFGCGPGLPSLTFASLVQHGENGDQLQDRHLPCVYATDLDTFALEMVQEAARCQGLTDLLTTQLLDLTLKSSFEHLPEADLYLMADVFESSSVAKGAAQLTAKILTSSPSRKNTKNDFEQYPAVWIFAQSDRAQRDVFLNELCAMLEDDTLDWHPMNEPPQSRLWLCDVDETTVLYG